MSNKKGQISVSTTDIFPIIKKWLYSEHDIFVRELVSNASDAITKRQTLDRTEGQEVQPGDVKVIINKEEKTITFRDNGLGMTEDEVEKYIAQLAFSGAEEFVKKMKETEGKGQDQEIIGKFGLGFFSAFMVADKVEVNSLSRKEGSAPTKWICNGETDYEFTDSDKETVGTDVILHINEESKEFLDSWKTRQTLVNYCDFMPYKIELVDLEELNRINEENAKATKEEDKKPIPCDIINDTEPLWKKDPSTLKDEDYKSFYKRMFPMDQEPLFWIHLNVDHPFTLQGILYFPKLDRSKPVNDSNIKLYNKQVFVSDNVKNVIPEFLSLLKGAIDSKDIPLNVSRSALQGDPNVKKISNYIIKKVAESLKKLYKNERERFETVWEDIALFVKYGVISDTKFDDLMRDKVLFKNTDDKLVTLAEYQEAVPENFKEKMKGKVVYFEEGKSDDTLRQHLKDEGIQSLTMDSYIDPHFMQHVEMKKQGDEEFKFTLVDNAMEDILETENASEEDGKIKDIFQEILVGKDKDDKSQMEIEVKNFKNAKSAAYFKVDESMKRFQQMTQSMGQANFDMPVKKTLVLNPSNNLIKNAFKLWEKDDKKDLAKKIAHYVQDLASISGEGLSDKERARFVNSSQELMGELSNLAL
ncbi:MAG: molecular chaperone HtpG [Halobacteriovoraceae bacterium]|nr:molecular chaperone HtpG [Halobacteriovoraceae bacterium]|tara:strand:- start:114029 stop:115957 length:1929 start_codon:yes stop_codon:yes gene_type:complete